MDAVGEVLLVTMSVMKVVFQFMGIIHLKPPPMWLGQLNDGLWMLTALVIPLTFDLVGIMCFRSHIVSMQMTFTPSQHAFKKVEPCNQNSPEEENGDYYKKTVYLYEMAETMIQLVENNEVIVRACGGLVGVGVG